MTCILLLLQWSGQEVDRIALDRDRDIVSLVLSQASERVAHAQESSTIWEEAVRQVRKRPLDLSWMDLNLGGWFTEYAGIDEVYVLDPHDRAIYAMRNGDRVRPESYIAVQDAASPLITKLRSTRSLKVRTNSNLAMLSPGYGEFVTVRGRPAVASVKPIVTDSAKLRQSPGSEAVHVAILYLDDDYFLRVARQYSLRDAHYAIAPSHEAGSQSEPIRRLSGDIIGYLIWKPFAPGSQVTSAVGPFLLIVLLLCTCVIYLLASRLARRTHDLEASRQDAQHRAMHDELTGLGNRVMFEQRLDEALVRSRRKSKLLALLYIDLDRFKQVNDTLGHPAGDALIQQVAQRLEAEVRGYDFVARLGGDEFAILIDEPENRATIERICTRVIAELERPFDLDGSPAFIGASVGVAVSPGHGLDRTELTRKADIALYRAKHEGRSRFCFFTPEMDIEVQAREEHYRDLRMAIADCDRHLEVHYQPIYAMRDGRMVGVEALLRWKHPQLGLIGPVELIRSAEEFGLIEVLGDWVLHRALSDALAWPGLRVAVNVSPIQLRSPHFASSVSDLLVETGFAANRLELELTETALMTASEDVARSLRALRALGVACALDDFGTGYSSLSHIRDLAVDRIKIDRSFVHAVGTIPGAALVEAIVSLARANGLQLTAEGVEDHAQCAFLNRVGCHEVQGFLMSQPVTSSEIDNLFDVPSNPRAIALRQTVS